MTVLLAASHWVYPLGYTRLTSTFADFSGNGFKHLLLLRETPF
jgi:hypothetical protein